MRRRGFLAGILAAGVAPLYVPNMKVWVPKEPVVTNPPPGIWRNGVAWKPELTRVISSPRGPAAPRVVLNGAAAFGHYFSESMTIARGFEKPVYESRDGVQVQPLAKPSDLVFLRKSHHGEKSTITSIPEHFAFQDYDPEFTGWDRESLHT